MNNGFEIRAVVYRSPGVVPSTFEQTHLERRTFTEVLARLRKSMKAEPFMASFCLDDNLAQSGRRKSMRPQISIPASVRRIAGRIKMRQAFTSTIGSIS